MVRSSQFGKTNIRWMQALFWQIQKGTSVLSIEYPDRPNVLAGVDGNGPIHTVALETVWGLRNPPTGVGVKKSIGVTHVAVP